MATSGTTTWNATRDQIITAALRKIAAIAEGDTPSAEMINQTTFILNGILKEAQADGTPLRPHRSDHRAHADRPVVRRHDQARRARQVDCRAGH